MSIYTSLDQQESEIEIYHPHNMFVYEELEAL